MAKDNPKVKPQVLRTTARAMLDFSSPEGHSISILTMAAGTKCQCVSRTGLEILQVLWGLEFFILF